MRTKADELRGRLARLEKLAGKGSCPYCRLVRRHGWLDATKPRRRPEDPSLIVSTRCEECGSPTSYDLSSDPEDLREMSRLYCTSKLEDTFTDPRAWAAQRWMFTLVTARAQGRKALREMRKLTAPAQTSYRQSGDAQRQRERERERAKDPDVKLYRELLAEVRALHTRRRRRLERQHGKQPFPELEARVDAVQAPDYDRLYKGEAYEHDVPFSQMYEIRQEAKSWQACAELEKIVLGEVTATTAGLLADCEGRAREVVAAARAKHEAREEKRRREEAERERRRLER